MAKYHGKQGALYMSASGSGDAVPVIGLTGWTLNASTDRVETTEFGASNKTYVQGYKDVSGNITGFWDSTEDALFDGADSTNGVKLYLYPTRDAPSLYWYGPAWVDFSVDVSNSGAISVSGTFAANGAWGRK